MENHSPQSFGRCKEKKNISLGFRKALRYPTGAKDIDIGLYISDKDSLHVPYVEDGGKEMRGYTHRETQQQWTLLNKCIVTRPNL